MIQKFILLDSLLPVSELLESSKLQEHVVGPVRQGNYRSAKEKGYYDYKRSNAHHPDKAVALTLKALGHNEICIKQIFSSDKCVCEKRRGHSLYCSKHGSGAYAGRCWCNWGRLGPRSNDHGKKCQNALIDQKESTCTCTYRLKHRISCLIAVEESNITTSSWECGKDCAKGTILSQGHHANCLKNLFKATKHGTPYAGANLCICNAGGGRFRDHTTDCCWEVKDPRHDCICKAKKAKLAKMGHTNTCASSLGKAGRLMLCNCHKNPRHNSYCSVLYSDGK